MFKHYFKGISSPLRKKILSIIKIDINEIFY